MSDLPPRTELSPFPDIATLSTNIGQNDSNSIIISHNSEKHIVIELNHTSIDIKELQQNPVLTVFKTKEKYKNLPKIKRLNTKIDLSESQKWLEDNSSKYLNQWVVLDGGKLIGAGDEPKPIVDYARKNGVEIPFVQFIEDDSIPYIGG